MQKELQFSRFRKLLEISIQNVLAGHRPLKFNHGSLIYICTFGPLAYFPHGADRINKSGHCPLANAHNPIEPANQPISRP